MPPVKNKGHGKPKSIKKTLRTLFSYLGKYRLLLVPVLIAVVLSSGAQVAGDSLMKPALDTLVDTITRIVGEKRTPVFPGDFLPFVRSILIMAGIYLAGAFASWLNARLMLYISSRTLYNVRTDLFHKMETLPIRYYDGHTHGELMSLYTNDTDTLRDMMSQTLPQMISSILGILGTLVMMIRLSPALTLIMVVTEFLMVFLAGKLGQKGAVAFRENQDALGKVNGYIEEMTEGSRVVKVFNREEKCQKEFDQLNDRLCNAGTRANTYGNVMGPIMGNLGHVQYALVAVCGAALAILTKSLMDGTVAGGGLKNGAVAFLLGLPMTIGSIGAFLQFTRSFSRPISMMSQQLNSVLNALAGAERIFNVLEAEPETDKGSVKLVNATEVSGGQAADRKAHLVQSFGFTGQWAWYVPESLMLDGGVQEDSYGAREGFRLRKLLGDVEFRDVSFSYVPEKEVLHHIDIHARPGQKIALVGSTGSGKTSITNLLTRFYDIDEGKGQILYDGIPLNEISKDDLRRSLGMVLQDTHLFTGTIRDNIRYGNLEASEKQVMDAAKLANADSFIRHLENGYDTVITGDGSNLSQGQRQLLAIARAAIADPPVLILDEATSSIDTRTEALIEKGMDSLMKGRSVFVIAHRLSTVRNADEIIVLEQGTIIERGNHQQLMEKKGRYYDLYTGVFELS